MVGACLSCAPDDHQSNARVLYRSQLSPCGTEISAVNPEQQPVYSFTGYEREDALELLDAGARMYNPQLCSFTAPDPIDDPRRSPFTYAANNPINHVDPNGMQEKPKQGGNFQVFLNNVHAGIAKVLGFKNDLYLYGALSLLHAQNLGEIKINDQDRNILFIPLKFANPPKADAKWVTLKGRSNAQLALSAFVLGGFKGNDPNDRMETGEPVILYLDMGIKIANSEAESVLFQISLTPGDLKIINKLKIGKLKIGSEDITMNLTAGSDFSFGSGSFHKYIAENFPPYATEIELPNLIPSSASGIFGADTSGAKWQFGWQAAAADSFSYRLDEIFSHDWIGVQSNMNLKFKFTEIKPRTQ